MNGLRHRVIRLSGALLFAALLLVPLAESGHSHANRDLARPCAVCVATHHSPAAIAPVLAIAASITRASAAVFSPTVAPARRDHSPQSGRAPPRSSFFVDGI
jgi:hypothetical protein